MTKRLTDPLTKTRRAGGVRKQALRLPARQPPVTLVEEDDMYMEHKHALSEQQHIHLFEDKQVCV